MLALIKQGDERGYWKIVYPEDWDEQVAEQEQAYWMSQKNPWRSPTRRMLNIFKNHPTTLWKRKIIKIKNETINGDNNEDK